MSFALSNFRSFKAKKTLDLTAATIKEYEESLFSTVGLSVLPSAVLYGANSSGKSNLIEAIRTFLTTVYDSASYNSSEELLMAPFMFDEDSRTKPSCFEIELLIDDDWYRYGFSAKKDRICEEYLYFKAIRVVKNACLSVRKTALESHLTTNLRKIWWKGPETMLYSFLWLTRSMTELPASLCANLNVLPFSMGINRKLSPKRQSRFQTTN